MTPIKAIRAKCLECSNGSYKEVRLCPASECPLYAYRFGHRPKGIKEHAEEAGEEKTSDSPIVSAKERHTESSAHQ